MSQHICPRLASRKTYSGSIVVVLCVLLSLNLLDHFTAPVNHTTASQTSDKSGITVCLPHYNNPYLLNVSLGFLRRRQRTNAVRYVIITQEDDSIARARIVKLFSAPPSVLVHELPQPGRIGGSALPNVFRKCLELCSSEVLLISDVDSFVLLDAWDKILLQHFTIKSLALAAINPRGQRSDRLFSNHAEWNWMALRCSLYREALTHWEGTPHGIVSFFS